MHRLGLAGLKTIEPHEQALGAEAVDLGHLVGAEDRAIGQVHGRFLARDERQSDGTE